MISYKELIIALVSALVTTLIWLYVSRAASFECSCGERVLHTSNYCENCGKQYRIIQKGGSND